MSLPRTILVPTDLGDPAEQAFDYAIALAAQLGARIVLLYVLRPAPLGLVEMGAVVTEGAVDSMLTAAQAELDRRAARGGVAVDTLVRTGEAHDVILQVAAEARADLIVMGTHGRRGIRRLLLGSVAEAVVRSAPCPVLTMHSVASAAA
jgi:nucleotide-binding universal stress UspA family protein